MIKIPYVGLINKLQNVLNEQLYMSVGALTDPAAPASFGAWMNHTATYHVGIIAFLVVDFLLFFGVAALTVVQASQVKI